MLIMFFFLALHFENSRHLDIHVLYYVFRFVCPNLCLGYARYDCDLNKLELL
jgi:hypothetical protein